MSLKSIALVWSSAMTSESLESASKASDVTLSSDVSLHTRIIRGRVELARLEQSWDDLWKDDPSATVFISFLWISTWVAHYTRWISKLFIVVCYRGDGLVVGIAPFYVRRPCIYPLQELLFAGTGEPEPLESCAEYLKVLTLPQYTEQCLDAVADCIQNEPGIRRLLLLRCIPEHARGLTRRLQARWQHATENNSRACYALDGDDPARAVASLRLARELARKRRRLEGLPGYAVQVVRTETDRLQQFARLVSLHETRWRGRGVFRSATFRNFHDSLSRLLLEQGQLLLFEVSLGERTLAVNYCLMDSRNCHYYQGGIDHSFVPNVSPGLVSHILGWEFSIASGRVRYDLMQGQNDSYKARLGKPWLQLVDCDIHLCLAYRTLFMLSDFLRARCARRGWPFNLFDAIGIRFGRLSSGEV